MNETWAFVVSALVCSKLGVKKIVLTSLDVFSFGDLFTEFTKVTHHFLETTVLGEDVWNFFKSIQQQQMKTQTRVETEPHEPQHFASIAEAWKNNSKKWPFESHGFCWRPHIETKYPQKIRSLDVSRFPREVSYSPTPSVGNNRQTPSSRWWACWELLKEPIQRWNGTIRDLWLGGGELKEVSQNGKIRNSDGSRCDIEGSGYSGLKVA